MNRILDLLTETLPRDTRELVTRRFHALEKQLIYYTEKGDKRALFAQKAGWGVERLKIVLALNAFYQIVLAPLASSAREIRSPNPMVNIDILYGSSFVCDQDWRQQVNSAETYFLEILRQMGIDQKLLFH